MTSAVLMVAAPVVVATETECRAIMDEELAAEWRPPKRPWPENVDSYPEYDLPEILIRYPFPPGQGGHQNGHVVVVTHRLSLIMTDAADVSRAHARLGQIVSEVTGLLRAYSVTELCSLATTEALEWRTLGLVRAILYPTPVLQLTGGRSMRWVKHEE